jgi:glycosyltransferase involved in cell wall biosynthesis
VTEYPDYRLVVCDDCSQDGTRELLQEWNDSGYFDGLFLSEVNLGVTNSRNQGIVRNPADYYVLVDDDTMHVKGWLSSAVRILESFGFGAVTTQRPLWELLEEPDKLTPLDRKLYRKTVDGEILQAMEIVHIGSCMIFPHSTWEKTGPMSHPEKRSGICRYSHRITDKGMKVARIYPPMSESIDMPTHPYSRRFTDYMDSYTRIVAPENMQNEKYYEWNINDCRNFDETHYVDTDGRILER